MKIGGRDMNWINKQILGNITTVLLGIAVAIVFGEVLLRVVLPILEPKIEVVENGEMLRPDPVLGFRTVPGGLGLDRRGFKNFSEATTSYAIVALGDSHTFGGFARSDEEDHSWPRQLSRLTGLSVYNMGVWGYGFPQYAVLADDAAQLSPRTIVIGVFMGNDVFDSYDVVYHQDGWDIVRDPTFSDSRPETSQDHKQLNIPFRGVRDALRKYSTLYAFMGDRTRAFRERIGISKARAEGTSDWTSEDPEVSLRFEAVRGIETKLWAGSRLRGVDLRDPNVREGLRLSEEFLVGIANRNSSRGIRTVYAFFPTKLSVYAEIAAEHGLSNPLLDAVVENETKIRERFLGLCHEHGITCVDVMPWMQNALREGKRVYPETWDEHPTALGYSVYAEAIRSVLSRVGDAL